MQESIRQTTFGRVVIPAVVVGVHVLLVSLLIGDDAKVMLVAETAAPTMAWLIFPDEHPEEEARMPGRVSPMRQGAPPEGADASIWIPDDATAQTTSVDWAASAERAAAKLAGEGPDRDVEKRPPLPSPKPFAWDKSSTERVSFPLTGGTAIRINDHCEIVLLPLPIGGCVIGRIEPRGDLFDEMNRPTEFGDWKDGAGK